MTDHTTRLGLPYLAAAQAQKHVTVNESLDRLDGLVACCVKSRSVSSPPESPAEGDAYIAPSSGLGGDWTGAVAGDLLRWMSGVWSLEPSPVGLVALVGDEASLFVRDEDGWRPLGERLGRSQSLDLLGVGTTADTAHPFAAKLNAALFSARLRAEGGDGDLRLTLNKEAAADVLSLLFQTGYAARAEIGLVGDDRLKLRVSADGAAFTDALTVESDGRVGVGTSAGVGVRLAVGGAPPTAAALSAVGEVGGFSLALSDNTHSSFYVRHPAGSPVVLTTDPGAGISIQPGRTGAAMTLDAAGGVILSLGLPAAANDAAAAAAGVVIGQLYRNGSAVQIRTA